MYFAGEGGKETAAWAKAAGMENFDTFRMSCWNELVLHNDFKWPDGIEEVDLWFGNAKFKKSDHDLFFWILRQNLVYRNRLWI